MAEKRALSPEKQLLKLIEDPKSKGADIRAQAVKRQGLGLVSTNAWISRFSFLKSKSAAWAGSGGLQHLDIRGINSILMMSVIALAFYLFTSVVMSSIDLKKKPELNFEAPGGTGAAAFQNASLLKAASFYSEQVRERDIFRIGGKKAKNEDAVAAPSSSAITDATQNLRLVGIAWSENPDAMIEDTSIPKTFFMKRGEKIGDIKIQAIFKDKVILNYEGQEIELK